MVIRNAKRRMNGLPVGTWRDEVDPDRVMKPYVERWSLEQVNGVFFLNKSTH